MYKFREVLVRCFSFPFFSLVLLKEERLLEVLLACHVARRHVEIRPGTHCADRHAILRLAPSNTRWRYWSTNVFGLKFGLFQFLPIF